MSACRQDPRLNAGNLPTELYERWPTMRFHDHRQLENPRSDGVREPQLANFTSWPHYDQVRDLAGNLTERPVEITASIIGRLTSSDRGVVPAYPLGVLEYIARGGPTSRPSDRDILDALELVVALRNVSIYLEVRLLRRGQHWRGWISQAEIGKRLGVSVSAVTNRRARLPQKIASGSPVQVRPGTPRVDTKTAVALATEVLDRREETQDEVERLPDPADLISVVSYALANERLVPVEVFVEDILACLSIVVSVRRQLDDLELTLLDLGRNHQVPNKLLGQPFGRRDQHATWKARRRLRNSSTGGRHEVVGYHVQESDSSEPSRSTPDTGAAAELRTVAAGLLQHHRSLADDEELDSWLRWLEEAGLHHEEVSLTRGGIGLLWTVFDDVAEAIGSLKSGASSRLRLTSDELTELCELVDGGNALRQRLRAAQRDQGNA